MYWLIDWLIEIYLRLLKELSSVIAEPLAKLFQNSLVQGIVSNNWREANITALFKKGSKSASQNYRPVSLTSIIATEDEVHLLRDDLKNVAKWAIDWQMLFNVEMCGNAYWYI